MIALIELEIQELEEDEEANEIYKCIRNIAMIPKGTIPLAREMGAGLNQLSLPNKGMENDYAVEMVEQLEHYEDRVNVEEITFTHNSDGRTAVKLSIVGKEKG